MSISIVGPRERHQFLQALSCTLRAITLMAVSKPTSVGSFAGISIVVPRARIEFPQELPYTLRAIASLATSFGPLVGISIVGLQARRQFFQLFQHCLYARAVGFSSFHQSRSLSIFFREQGAHHSHKKLSSTLRAVGLPSLH